MNTSALRQYKASLTMSNRQKQILDGLLLGDGHLERQRGALSARLKIEHSISQVAYVAWKYEEWRDWVRTPPRERQRRNRLGSLSTNVGFTTLSHPELERFRQRHYEDGRKIVPQDLVLNPLTVAVWFMDDGSKKSNQCRGLLLNTQSFIAPEVDSLRSMILRDVGVETSVRKQSDGLQIYIPSPSVAVFTAFVIDEMLPSMMYKLSG
jgi:hypothetical protein